MHVLCVVLLGLATGVPQREVTKARELERRAHDLQKAGRYEEAEKPLLQAAAIWKRYRGGEDIEVLNDEMNLAVSYRRRGQTQRALPMLERVAAGFKVSSDGDAPALYRSALNNVSAAYRDMGRLDDARRALETCLKSVEPGGRTEERARVLDNLAGVLVDKGDLAAAEPIARRALSEWKSLRSEEDADVSVSMGVVGTVLMRQGKTEQARPLLEKALAIAEKVRGGDHPEVGAALNLVGELEWRAGHKDVARKFYQGAVTLLQRHFDDSHPLVKDALDGMRKTDENPASP